MSKIIFTSSSMTEKYMYLCVNEVTESSRTTAKTKCEKLVLYKKQKKQEIMELACAQWCTAFWFYGNCFHQHQGLINGWWVHCAQSSLFSRQLLHLALAVCTLMHHYNWFRLMIKLTFTHDWTMSKGSVQQMIKKHIIPQLHQLTATLSTAYCENPQSITVCVHY